MTGPDGRRLAIEPVVSWPRRIVAGETYRVEVEIRAAAFPGTWPAGENDLEISLLLDGAPHTKVRSIGPPTVTLHRAGGTSGPASFLVTPRGPEGNRSLRLTVCSQRGLPLRTDELPVEIVAGAAPETGLLGGRYRLLDRRGAGRTSVVWVALDETLDRTVAVRVFPPSNGFDAGDWERLRAESQIVKGLSEPAVADVYDWGEAAATGGAAVRFLVTEFLAGESLADRLAREQRLDWATAAPVLTAVTAALAAAHSAGVVHRDVSPAAVTLTSSGAKLADFGVSAMAGEPAYPAPEQAESPAADVYAFGVLLYRTLTGRLPEEVPDLRGLPAPAAAIVQDSLSPLPAARPSAYALHSRLVAAQRTADLLVTAGRALPAGSGHVFLDRPATADLRAKVTEAWLEFAGALAELLPTLSAGGYVDITLDPTTAGTGTAIYSVNLRVLDGGAVEALAVGNAELPAGFRMDRSAVADLVALGWSPPGVLPGSGGSFGLRSDLGHANGLATTVSRTMRDVYGAPHPAFLVFVVRDDRDEPIEAAALATARPEPTVDPVLVEALENAADEVIPLDERVRSVVAAMSGTTVDQLQLDTDGDIGIRAGSAMVFVRTLRNPPLVDVFSPVLTEVAPTHRLYVQLSELTNRMPIGRLYCAQDTVWASIPVFGRNFQATHLMLALQVMTGLADELDDRLQREFGGKRFFGEGDKPG
jgi:hypothetical protein